MSGFQYPPPPPPPPPPSTSSTPIARGSQYGSAVSDEHGSGRGSRGRGRVRADGRGRGGHDGRRRGGWRGGSHSEQQNASNQHINHGQASRQESVRHDYAQTGTGPETYYTSNSIFPTMNALPPGTYVNPSYQHINQSSYTGQDLATQYTNYPKSDFPQQQSASYNQHAPYNRSTGPPRTAAGQKRKLDALRGPNSEWPKIQAPPVAPSVPGFGTSSLPPKQQSPVTLKHNGRRPDRHQPANRSLGLTPNNEYAEHASSESDDAHEEDVDEEELLGSACTALGGGLIFEHEGTVLCLNTAEDLKDWRRERSRNFPTQSRIPEREAEKRRVAEHRKQLIADATEALRAAINPVKKESELDKLKREVVNRELDLERARRRLSKSEEMVGHYHEMSTTVKNRTTGVANQNAVMDDAEHLGQAVKETQSIHQSPVVDEGSAFLNSEAAEEIRGMDNNAQSTTSTSPCVPSSKRQDDVNPLVLDEAITDTNEEEFKAEGDNPTLRPSTTSSVSSPDSSPPEEKPIIRQPPRGVTKQYNCRFFSASGFCRDGDACRFKHVLSESGAAHMRWTKEERQERGKRDPFAPTLDQPVTHEKKSIHQRLMEREEEQEDKLALHVIKYLGQAKFFDAQDG